MLPAKCFHVLGYHFPSSGPPPQPLPPAWNIRIFCDMSYAPHHFALVMHINPKKLAKFFTILQAVCCTKCRDVGLGTGIRRGLSPCGRGKLENRQRISKMSFISHHLVLQSVDSKVSA